MTNLCCFSCKTLYTLPAFEMRGRTFCQLACLQRFQREVLPGLIRQERAQEYISSGPMAHDTSGSGGGGVG